MAASPGPGAPTASANKGLKDLQASLYTACRSRFALDQLFFQEDLLKLNIIPDDNLETLLRCAQALTNQKLFRLHAVDDRACWKVVKEEDAAKYTCTLPA